MIDIKHLRTIKALSLFDSLQRAAEHLCVTQSALSHQLKELEYRLGVTLFQRKTQPVQFSPHGLALLQLADKVLPAVDATVAQLKAVSDTGQIIRITVECHACFHWLLPAVRQFKQQFSAATIEFIAMPDHNAIEALQQCRLDVVLTTDIRQASAVHYEKVFDMELRLLVSPEHSLAQLHYVVPQQLLTETIFSYPIPAERQDLFRHVINPMQFQGRVKPVEQGSQILQLVAANQGIAALPSWMAEPYHNQGLIQSLAINEQGLWLPMYFACRQADRELPATAALLATICQRAPILKNST